jgi:pimeloyl-ACP methyl ester carboxylesterase
MSLKTLLTRLLLLGFVLGLLTGLPLAAQDVTPTPGTTGMELEAEVMPMPGQLVDVGGYRLHLYCLGEGSPTVVLDPGGGDWSLVMLPLQQQLAEFTQTCVYDVAGSGWSDVGRLPVTAQQRADDLHALLTNAEVESPYVLVGHSYSGLNVRLLASQHPEDVAAVVLIDGRPPGTSVVQREQFPETAVIFEQQLATLGTFIEMLAAEPLSPEAAAQFVPDEFVPPTIPAELAQTYKQHLATLGYMESMVSMIENMEVSEEQVATAELGDIPLVLLVQAEPEESPMEPERARALQQAWIELQQEQAESSTQSKLILVEDTGHYIYIDQPQVVVDAIREVVEAVREA